MSKFTSMSLKPRTKSIIQELGRPNETYDDTLMRIIDDYLAGGRRLPDWAKESIKRQEEIIEQGLQEVEDD